MAIVLEANYARKLGLPNFSSHQYAVSIRTELTDLTQVEAGSARLYQTLHDAVDREIQEVGFPLDAATCGLNPPAANGWEVRAAPLLGKCVFDFALLSTAPERLFWADGFAAIPRHTHRDH